MLRMHRGCPRLRRNWSWWSEKATLTLPAREIACSPLASPSSRSYVALQPQPQYLRHCVQIFCWLALLRELRGFAPVPAIRKTTTAIMCRRHSPLKQSRDVHPMSRVLSALSAVIATETETSSSKRRYMYFPPFLPAGKQRMKLDDRRLETTSQNLESVKKLAELFI